MKEFCSVEGDGLFYDPMVQDPEGIPHRLISIPLVNAAFRPSVKTIVEVVFFVQQPVTQDQGRRLVIDDVVPYTQSRLFLFVDLEGKAGGVGPHPPVVKVFEGFVKPYVQGSGEVIIGLYMGLLAIHPAAGEVYRHVLFCNAEFEGVAQDIGFDVVGVVDDARTRIGKVKVKRRIDRGRYGPAKPVPIDVPYPILA